MIRDIPDAKVQLIVRPTGVFRTWGMRSPHRLGLFGLQGPPGYISLSDAFFREEGVGVDRFEDQGMIHEQELAVEASWGPKLWDDSHTGSNDVGSAWVVDVGPFDDAKSRSSESRIIVRLASCSRASQPRTLQEENQESWTCQSASC